MEKIVFKDFPDTTTPIDADNLNLLQDNVEDGINGTVLWTNPNSNATFAGQSITTLSMTPYKSYKIWFKHYINYNYLICSENLVGYGGYVSEIDEGGNRNGRKFTYTNDTTIAFDNALSNGITGANDNNRLIPVKIVGYK